MIPPARRSPADDAKRTRELERREEALDRAEAREDREREHSNWRDEAADVLARTGRAA